MIRTVLRPRWLALHAVVLLIVVAFCSLGAWQLRRLDDRRTANAATRLRLAQAPIPLDEALAGDVGSAEYTPVTVTGVYDPGGEVLVRGRSWNREPGFGLLTPLLLEDGTAVLVDRGWVPSTVESSPVDGAAPAVGSVRVSGYLRAPQVRQGLGPTDPETGVLTRIARVDVERLQSQVEAPLVAAWIQMTSETPASSFDLPRRWGEPDLSEGPHLSYAIQWFSFAIISVVGYAFLVRKAIRGARTQSA